MSAGGTLTIETANVTVTEADARGHELAPGRYVMMAVHDTGLEWTRRFGPHFEPFFTTKETAAAPAWALPPSSASLSRAAVSSVASRRWAQGTTFRIFLPAVAEAMDTGAIPAGGLANAPKGSEVILLVEDEDVVRVLARRILKASGYVVYEARNGREGLALVRSACRPDRSPSVRRRDAGTGRARARGGRPETATRNQSHVHVRAHAGRVLKEGVQKGMAFLHKPFTPIGLVQKVRETLDSTVRSPGECRWWTQC